MTTARTPRTRARWKWIAAAVGILLVGYLVVVGVLRSLPVELPAPGGAHPVGR